MLADMTKLVADLAGAASELTLYELNGRLLRRFAPRATRRQPVLTLPGFMGSEQSFTRMHRFLNEQGFSARGWGLGRNRGPQGEGWSRYLDNIRRHLTGVVKEMADRASAPVSLVGHSLGGIYARDLAHHLEDESDRVITLGAPTIHPYRRDRHNQVLKTVSNWVNRRSLAELGGRAGLLHWDADRPRMPCVAIHSPLDGFVSEAACHIPGYIVAQSSPKAPRENIRVLATHTGMTFNVWVLLAIADRLVRDRRHWAPFDPAALFPGSLSYVARWAYPGAEELWRDRGPGDFVEMNQ